MNMDYEQLQRYQQSLLDRALTEGIRRNEEQTKTWSEYKERHQKVIEGLETFREDLTVSCMVPIGKKAMMRGKLTHTNEILVSLGEGYFAKYSAAQAVALCNRRIKRASDILDSLQKERNLYEMRQKIPNSFDAFGSNERKEFVEYWDKEKLDDWRVEHRQREIEYRKKLAELRSTEKPEIQSEEDLFNRLAALELQEELEDELNRLEAARPDFYTQDLGDGEVDEESESDTDSDESETIASEDEFVISDIDENMLIIDESKPSIENTVPASSQIQIDSTEWNPSIVTSKKCKKSKSKSGRSRSKFFDFWSNDSSSDNSAHKSTEMEQRERRVVFGEPQVKYFRKADRIATDPEDSEIAIASTSASTSDPIEVEIPNDVDAKEDQVIRIEFKHSEFEPEIPEIEYESIESPRDIYRMLSKPKSILKKSPNRFPQEQRVNYIPPADISSDEGIEDSPAGVSAYSTIVKEICEHVPDAAVGNSTVEPVKQKRPVSKFKRDRANSKRPQ